jgi:TetR/AcrR family transcriptional regulator, fatty acid metabolism regulator protein
MTSDFDSTQTSRQRLLEAGKTLFAKQGFEQTSTAAIAREAGTSESQLVRYYRSKVGLLEAIFNENWRDLNQKIQQVVVAATDAREALAGVLESVSEAFGKDPALAYLLLFEGRRIRGSSSEIILSKGFVEFDNLLHVLIHRGKRDGTFRNDLDDNALASALLGATEAMIRDRLLAQRAGRALPYGDPEMRAIFFALLHGLQHKVVQTPPAP